MARDPVNPGAPLPPGRRRSLELGAVHAAAVATGGTGTARVGSPPAPGHRRRQGTRHGAQRAVVPGEGRASPHRWHHPAGRAGSVAVTDGPPSWRRRSRPGETRLLDGRPAVVLYLLPKLPGRRPAVRAAFDLPCGACEAPLRYDAPRRQWWCSGCSTVYDREALADLAREHLQDGTKVGKARSAAPERIGGARWWPPLILPDAPRRPGRCYRAA